MDSSYKYKRLDLSTDAIRLIRILKGHQGPIKCEMLETCLNQVEGIPYEALSYVWGNNGSIDEIWVDGCPFIVTENLFEALSNLRQFERDRLLWIDAICIDQSHDAERGHQVGQMYHIYHNADNVIIWLGGSTADIDCLFYWMRCLDHQMVVVEHGIHQSTTTMWEHQWKILDLDPRRNLKFHSSSMISGIHQLFRKKWFSRIWVIQEAAMAKAATINCGHNTISSRTFVVMPILLNICCTENVQSRLEIMPGLLRRTSWWSLGPNSQGLHVLLQKFGFFSEATDTRDIIYALLGLSKHASTSTILRPNYQITAQTLIKHTVAYLLVQSGHVKEDHASFHDMPTWDMTEFLASLDNLPDRVRYWKIEQREANAARSSPYTSTFRKPGTGWISVDEKYSKMLKSWSTKYDTLWTAIHRERWDHAIFSVGQKREVAKASLQIFDTVFYD